MTSKKCFLRFQMFSIMFALFFVGSGALFSAHALEKITFSPSDDATLNLKRPNKNYNSRTLEVDDSSRKHILLKFAVKGINQRTVMNAALQLHTTDSSEHGGELFQATHHNWNEQTVAWNSSPEYTGNVIDSLARVKRGQAYSWDITSLIQADGIYSMRIKSPSRNGADYSSKEGSHPPKLIVTVSDDVPPPNSPPSVSAGSNQAISLPNQAQLSGTVTDDGLPNPPGTVSMTWSHVSGPTTATIAEPNQLETAIQFSEAGDYRFRLTANDSILQTSDDMSIIVSAPVSNTPPTVQVGADQTTVVNNSLELSGTVTDDGLPTNTLTHQWSQESGPETASFDQASSLQTTVTFNKSGVYVLQLTSSDSQLTSSDELTVTAAAATAYHVSKQGNNNNPGTFSQPWASIQHGVNHIQAGDTLIIHGGSYQSESVWISQANGTSSKPIHIRAASGETPILQSIQFRNHNSWYILEGLTFHNTRFNFPSSWQDMPEVMVDDTSIVINPKEDWATREGKVRQKYSTFMALDDTMQNNWSIGIHVENGNHIIIRGNHVEGYTTGIQTTSDSGHILVEENTSYRCGYGFFAYAPSPSMHDSIVRKNDFRQSLRAGISFKEGSFNNLIEENFTQHSAISGITLNKGNHDNIIRHNVSKYGGYYSETMRYPGSTAINIHTSGPGNILDGNFAAHQIDWTLNDGNGFSADLMRDGAGVTFINNIAYRNMGSGITMTESPNAVIKHNIFIENGYQTRSLRNGAGVRFSRDEDIDNIVSGNIFFNNGTAGLYAGHRNLVNQTHVDHNLYFSNNGKPFLKDDWGLDDRNYFTLEQIQSNSNAEDHGVAEDPLFIDKQQEDFHLQPASPAISHGDPTLAPATDKDDNNRDSQPDIGAYEYQN